MQTQKIDELSRQAAWCFIQATPQLTHVSSGGHVVGELGFYLRQDRTAAVIADEPTIVYRFDTQTLRQLERTNLAAAAAFHKLLAHLLGQRVVHLITSLSALQ